MDLTFRATGYALGWLRDTAEEAATIAAECGTRPGHFAEAAALRLLHDRTSRSGRVTIPADPDVLEACVRALNGQSNAEDGDAAEWTAKGEHELARMARAACVGFGGLAMQVWRAAYAARGRA
jgi:hypothetical protein